MQKNQLYQQEGESSEKRHFTRRDFLSTSLKVGAVVFGMNAFPELGATAREQYNVLFIMVDDLRPLLGCYGHPEIHSPNIDALAQRGTLFNRAYCQYPLCNPTRSSILSGLRPDTTNVHTNSVFVRDQLPNMVTMPQHFKEHGYYTQSLGKISHRPKYDDNEFSWSVPSWRPRWKPVDKPNTPSWSAPDVADDTLSDGQIADRAVDVLEEIKGRRFFLGVGFRKPHFPLESPKKYYDLYDPYTLNLPVHSQFPENAPKAAYTNWNSIRAFQDLPNGQEPLSDSKILEIVHAYVAAISFIDAQIGRVLQQLNATGLDKNTVVVFCGDHGHHIGDHGIIGKGSLFEASLHSPLIVSVPGQSHAGNKTDALVELVDIYPTLCDVCQIPIRPELEGLSMMQVIQGPTLSWKTGAFSQLGRRRNVNRSIRTEQHRYTEWGPTGSFGIELYDSNADPDGTVNIANFPENAELVAHLRAQLHAGWRAALPKVAQQTPLPQTLPWDINNDGIVDIQDMILVYNNFDVVSPKLPKVDVNKDGSIDIVDLLLVAVHFGESSNPVAPATRAKELPEHLGLMAEWLTEARLTDNSSDVFRDGIAALEHLIDATVPSKTVLLPNYPNPFNPDTWIPYDLAEDADVHIHIYNLKGKSIRQLSVGLQAAGTYRTRSRAAYWDGQNAVGEPVASGIYFYTLQAGKFETTHKMVILK